MCESEELSARLAAAQPPAAAEHNKGSAKKRPADEEGEPCVRFVHFDAEGKRLVTGGDDKTVSVWDTAALKIMGTK